jgi:hypothetical protein
MFQFTNFFQLTHFDIKIRNETTNFNDANILFKFKTLYY